MKTTCSIKPLPPEAGRQLNCSQILAKDGIYKVSGMPSARVVVRNTGRSDTSVALYITTRGTVERFVPEVWATNTFEECSESATLTFGGR